MIQHTIIVIPCFDEARRLDLDRIGSFIDGSEGIDFLFVNDGSRDETLARLREFEKTRPTRVAVRDQQPNRGKAEAVRVGMLEAFDRQPAFVGYWDADLATPLEEIERFLDAFDRQPERQMVIGSRVKLLGRTIERDALRHYLGRVAATVASMVLGIAVYDTQCGAKLFRANESMRALFSEPFCSSWVFDVEMIARLIAHQRIRDGVDAEQLIYELPLLQWQDVPGSKVKSTDFIRAFIEIARVHRRYLGARARRQQG